MRWLALVALLGCSSKAEPDLGPAAFPADYSTTYKEVRSCRPSTEHDLNRIRVLADPAALGPYQTRIQPIPTGAIVLKEEYDTADVDCSGPIKQWTVMVRLDPNASPTTLDWHWQRVTSDRTVVERDAARCFNCHSGCTPDMNGYEYTCTVPP